MDCSIIIINYKSASLVLDCIRSIRRESHKYQYEIIVVDNASGDQCRQQLEQEFADIRWIQMKYNAGFARANNTGIEASKGKYVLLLNPDTLILEGAIDKSMDRLAQYPEAVGCGVQLLNTDGTHQISGAHVIRGGLNTLLPLPYLGAAIRYFGYLFKSTVPSVQSVQKDLEVDWIVGAYLLVKKETLAKSGLLDSDFFMYAEEIEWCARLRKQGKLMLFAEPKVIHIGGGTSSDYYNITDTENGKNLWNKKGRQVMVSNMLRIRKQFGIGWFLFITGVYVFEIPLFVLCLFFDKILKLGKTWHTWKNAYHYAVNVTILLSYFLRMMRNKPYFYKVA